MSDKKQIDKFKEAARKFECNQSEKDFDRELKKLTDKKPKQPASEKP